MSEDKSQNDVPKNTESEENLPEWLKDYEYRYRKIYQELMKTSVSRNKQHEEALAALDEAVNTANRLTLEFLESLNPSVEKEDLNCKK